MKVSHVLIALFLGITITLLQFVLVARLNQQRIAQRKTPRAESVKSPIVLVPPPEKNEEVVRPPSKLKSPKKQSLSASTKVQPSALSADGLAPSPLSLGSFLPVLGEVEFGVTDVSDPTTESDRRAKVRRSASPIYPISARRQGIEGYVLLRLSIDKSGQVKDAIVVDSEPMGVFEKSARDAAMRFEFTPALVGGVPVSTTIEKKVTFTLQ